MLKAEGLDPEIAVVPIVVVGTGGTGAHLIDGLIAVNETLIKLGYKGIRVIAYDGDRVSLSNIGRQPFTPMDYDKVKSVTLIEKINDCYGYSWVGMGNMFTINSIADLNEMKLLDSHGILISCVDNVKVRRVIQTLYNADVSTYSRALSHLSLWMDIGNERNFGQIIFGSKPQKIPTVFDVFENMEEHETNDAPSCSVIEALSKQSVFINKFMATFAANMIKDLITNMYLPYSQLYFNLEEFTINTK